MKNAEKCKKLCDYFKEWKKYEGSGCYLEYEKAPKNQYVMFKCLKCGKIFLFIADYSIPKFPSMFEYCRKYLENFILSLRTSAMCCE